jgi:hypothetical protein
MEKAPDQEPSGFETSSELRRDQPPAASTPTTAPPAPTTAPPDTPRSNRRVWAVVLAVLVVGLLAYLLFTQL